MPYHHPMIDRRNLLLGSAPLALFLAAGPGLATDPESAQVLERVRALWREHARRADELRAGVIRAAGSSVDAATLDVIAEGISWAGVMATCARETTRDLCHPAFQAAVHEAAVAMGDTIAVLDGLLARVAGAAIDNRAFVAAYDAVTGQLDATGEDPLAMTLLRGATRELRDELGRDGLEVVVARRRRRLTQARALAEGITEHGSGTLHSVEPRLLADVAAGKQRWGATETATTGASDNKGEGSPARAGLGPGAVAGAIALGLVIAGGLVVFGLGATTLACACVGIAIMLVGLTLVVLGAYGISRIVTVSRAFDVAGCSDGRWRPAVLPASGWNRGRLWATGTIRDSRLRHASGPRGRALVLAGEGAPSPGGKFGALLGRVPSGVEGHYNLFYAMNSEITSHHVGRLELAVNVPLGRALTGPGYRVLFRPLP